ncbi:MAG: hypothetical protein GXY32_05520 [Ruminococcaceae bacterium]|nr:hypothetical protein [Oscillospiraceae bacterium]
MMLSVQEVAQLRGCQERAVRQQIIDGKLPSETTINDRNRKKYLVPLDALEPRLQARWQKQQAPAPGQTPKQSRPLEQFTAAEREEIDLWIDTLERWQSCRNQPGVKSKAEVDRKFVLWFGLEHPDTAISEAILYRKLRAWRDGDLDGLLDKRGKWRKGQTDMPDQIWQAFLTYYLDEAQHPIARCIEYTRLWAQECAPELVASIPSYSTFRRHALELAEPVRVYGREGAKAYYDRSSLYVRRTYEDMESNDWWVADNHTFDIQSQTEDGHVHGRRARQVFEAGIQHVALQQPVVGVQGCHKGLLAVVVVYHLATPAG